MKQYYFKIALRNILRNKLFSSINIIGLAVGITAFLMILVYVRYERSYDTFHKNSDRIYRLLYERSSAEGETVKFASCCPPAAILSLIHISEPTRQAEISYAVFCLK